MNLRKEQKMRKKGYNFVAGLDESGRGALCGPVIACAVTVRQFSIFNLEPVAYAPCNCFAIKQFSNKLREVNDSKKLSPKKRKELYEILINHRLIEWGMGKVGPKVIDRINILEATKLAMKRAIKNLESRTGSRPGKVAFLILDGKMNLDIKIKQESIVKADGKVFSCAAASIISKVTRDRAMNRYHKKYPQYNFAKHKGYGTEHHRKMIRKYGPCEIHRRSFKPIKLANPKSQIPNNK